MKISEKKKDGGRDMKSGAECIFKGQCIHSLVSDIKEETIHAYLDALLTFPVLTSPLSPVFHLLRHCVQWAVSGLMRMMCYSDKTRLWPPVKH